MIADGRFTLLRTTLLDFPGKVAAAVFLPGCHLRCPYCHNPELVDPAFYAPSAGEYESLNANLALLGTFLARRSRVLGGLAVSGGEALLSPLLPEILRLAKACSLPVKLDTAGLLPDRLEAILDSTDQVISYVAIDLKTLPERYGELGWKGSVDEVGERIEQTITLLKSRNIDFELRTTVVPRLVDAGILRELLPIASAAPRWIWQCYQPGRTLDPDWSDLKAPKEEDLQEILDEFSEAGAFTEKIRVR